MRAWLVAVAALALAAPRAAAPPDPRLERVKSHILAKLGLSTRPMPLGAPPRDVVAEILHRARDSQPEKLHTPESEHAMREIIAIAQTGCEEQLASNFWLANFID